MFANPIAGRGKALRIAQALRDRLSDDFAVENFSLPAVLVDPSRLSAAGRPEAVVCVGGDGTLQGVAEVTLRRWRDPPPILLVPLGTANLIAKHLRLPWSEPRHAERIARALEARRTMLIDACRCNGRLFLAVAGIGFDADVVHRLHRNRSGPITKNSYVLPTVAALRTYDFPRVRVMVDGSEVFPEAPGLVYVGNVREYGTGIPMLPHAVSNDRLLDVCVLPCRSKRQALKWMMRAAINEHIGHEGAVYVRGRHARVDAPTPVAIQLDGEAAGHTPAEIELLDRPLEFVVA